MGMMINRRRVMGGKEDTYIQNGLVFWIDGIWNKSIGVHDDNMLYLNDLTNNHQITWTGNVSFETNGAYFDTNVFASFYSDYIVNAINDDKATVEILIKPISKGKGSNAGYFAFCKNVRGFWCWDNPSYALSGFSYRTDGYTQVNSAWTTPRYSFHILLNNNKFVIRGQNGIIIQKNAVNKQIVNDNLCLIGSLFGDLNSAANFVLHSIRVYDRTLTQEELSHNFELDKKRFDLTFQ